MIIRRERHGDHDAVRGIHAAAFDRGGGVPVEVGLLDALREDDGWLAHLSWVAEIDGRVVGHVVSTRAHVDDLCCVGLGPIGVAPEVQRVGVGSALVHVSIGAADASGEPLIALLGDPDYYSRFGFVASSELGVEAPDVAWGVHFQALPLSAWTAEARGAFKYATPFDEVD
ncbi:MAG: GNAT family N-acetyltransferase [Ilumatobacter sp.]